jgi:hypothetical protein
MIVVLGVFLHNAVKACSTTLHLQLTESVQVDAATIGRRNVSTLPLSLTHFFIPITAAST